MSQDFLSQQEVDALLKGVTGEDDWAAAMGEAAELKPYPRTTTLNMAERELAYWTGVIHALTGKVKAPNVELTGAARLYRAASRERSERG